MQPTLTDIWQTLVPFHTSYYESTLLQSSLLLELTYHFNILPHIFIYLLLKACQQGHDIISIDLSNSVTRIHLHTSPYSPDPGRRGSSNRGARPSCSTRHSFQSSISSLHGSHRRGQGRGPHYSWGGRGAGQGCRVWLAVQQSSDKIN